MRLAHGLLVILLFLTACAPATEAQKPPLHVVILNYDRTGHILGFLPEGNTEIDIDETYLIFVDEATFQNFTVGEVVAQDLTVITEGDQRGNIFIPINPIAASVWIYQVTVEEVFVTHNYIWSSTEEKALDMNMFINQAPIPVNSYDDAYIVINNLGALVLARE